MMNLWTSTKLLSLDFTLRKKIKFYAPLLYSLDFHGVDPVTYTRAGTFGAIHRDGGTHTLAANVPPFEWSAGLPQGLWLATPATLQYGAGNGLSSADTIIWAENGVWKSTPSQGVPFDGNGAWAGNLNIHLSHVVKASSVLSNSEINLIQTILTGTTQVIPAPPAPPVNPVGSFISESPSGSKNSSNKIFTLSQNPDLGSLAVYWAGLYLKRVAAAPAELEYTADGAGNRTLTLGSAPDAGQDLSAQYVISA